MQVFGLIGWQDSGKTTLMVKLIPEIIDRGHTVSSMNTLITVSILINRAKIPSNIAEPVPLKS